MKKDVPFIWTPDHDFAFEAVKKLLQSPPTWAQFDVTLPSILMTDASRLNGLGFALFKDHG